MAALLLDELDSLRAQMSSDLKVTTPSSTSSTSSTSSISSTSPAEKYTAPASISSALSPFDQTISHVSTLLSSPEVISAFQSNGFAVLDNAIAKPEADAFRNEIMWLHENGYTGSNHTAYVVSHEEGSKPSISTLVPKPHIYECEVNDYEIRKRLDRVKSLFEQAVPAWEAVLHKSFPDLQLYHGDTSIKVQYNDGTTGSAGGCFPFHFDSPGGLKDSRRLTLLIYLNPGWKEGDGGELVFQPFLQQEVHVRPLHGRIAMFRSDRMLHRVLRNRAKERVCLTIWFHGKALDPPEPASDPSLSTEARLYSLINHPPLQRTLCKSVYTDSWARSYIEAHGVKQAKNVAPKQFSNSVAVVAGSEKEKEQKEATSEQTDKTATAAAAAAAESAAGWDPLDLLGDGSDSAPIAPIEDEEEEEEVAEELSGGSLLAASLRNDAKLFETAEPSMRPVIALLKELAAEHEGKSIKL